MGSERIRACRG